MGERGELPLASPSPVPGHLFKIGVTSINSNTARRRDESSDDFRKLLHGVFEDAGVLRVGGVQGGIIPPPGCQSLSHLGIAQHFTCCLQLLLHCFEKETDAHTIQHAMTSENRKIQYTL